VTVALQDSAGELAAAYHEHALIVLLKLLDQGDEVAIAAHNCERADVIAGKGHLQGVESQVDVRSVLVAARGDVALHHLHRMLRQLAAEITGARPVSVCRLAHNFATFLQCFEHDGDIEFLSQGVFDPNLNIVKVDKNGELQSFFCHSSFFRRA